MERNLAGEGMPGLQNIKTAAVLVGRMQQYYISILVLISSSPLDFRKCFL